MFEAQNVQEKIEEMEDVFCLDDYDCIGFDMDHTVVQYHIEELFKVYDAPKVMSNGKSAL